MPVRAAQRPESARWSLGVESTRFPAFSREPDDQEEPAERLDQELQRLDVEGKIPRERRRVLQRSRASREKAEQRLHRRTRHRLERVQIRRPGEQEPAGPSVAIDGLLDREHQVRCALDLVDCAWKREVGNESLRIGCRCAPSARVVERDDAPLERRARECFGERPLAGLACTDEDDDPNLSRNATSACAMERGICSLSVVTIVEHHERVHGSLRLNLWIWSAIRSRVGRPCRCVRVMSWSVGSRSRRSR